MKKVGYLLLLVLLFSGCNIVYNVRHGNHTIDGCRKCAANDPIGWHYRSGTGHSLKHPVRRVRQ